MIRKGTKARPPLSYTAISPTAFLQPLMKNSLNYARDVTSLYANTSVAGLKKRSRTQPADQQSVLMGDINIVPPSASPGPTLSNINQKSPSPALQERIGGPRAATALNSKARIASNLYDNQVNVQGVVTPTGLLTQSGTSTTILVAASTLYAGDLTISYSGGSVNPGAFGTWFIFASDVDFKGGAVIYQASSAVGSVQGLGLIFFGSITTVAAGGGTGGGGGGSGGRKIA